MSDAAMREYAKIRGFHPITLERWTRWEEADGEALRELAVDLKASENHLRDIMDWLEEISLREHTKIYELLARPEIVTVRTHPRLGRADKLKRIKEQLRRWRFPRLAATEDSLAACIKALQLPRAIRLSAPPGLEGGRLRAEFEVGTAADLYELSGRLRDAAASEAMTQIFETLAGTHLDDEQDGG
jgi:hypothetical protein